ncbi:MAG: RNase adapter RapZ [Rhodobacterales bacterium]|nr:MAG: RNase adapter RapZ [Rhodobacterales bacterium]
MTGASGAGRSTALRALEDLGYEVIDNLPQRLLPHLLQASGPDRPLAIGVDVRNRDFDPRELLAQRARLDGHTEWRPQILFLDCRADILVRRYSETRRRHPLGGNLTAQQAIESEIVMTQELRDGADYLIDTSDLTVHNLRAEVERLFAPEGGRALSVQVQSFSYKRGLPRGLDLVFDVRFLRNPHWVEALRPGDGRDPAVAEYVAGDPLFEPFFSRVADLTALLLPAYKAEGKTYLSIGFGCSGGRHRSVTLAEAMAKTLADQGWQVSIRHRELERADHGAP